MERKKILSGTFIAALLVFWVSSTNPFMTVLRFFLSFVNLGAFFVRNQVTHVLSQAWIGIVGFQNQELILVEPTSWCGCCSCP